MVPISENVAGGLAMKASSWVYSAWEATLIVIVPRPLRLSTDPSAMNWAAVSTTPELIDTLRPDGSVARPRSTVPAFTSRFVKPVITLPAANTTVSWASTKSNTRVSPVAVRPLVLKPREREPAPAISATLITRRSVPSPRFPLRLSEGALGMLRVKVSMLAVPVKATFRAVPASLLITLVPMAATLVAASTPPRVKVATPLESTLTLIGPVALPEKFTPLGLSVRENTSVTAIEKVLTAVEPSLDVALT